MSSFPALNGAPGIDNFQADFNSLSARALAYIQANVGLTPPVTLTNTNAAQVPLAILGAAAQTANLQEWRTSASVVLAAVNASGGVSLRNSSGAERGRLEVFTGAGEGVKAVGGDLSNTANAFIGGENAVGVVRMPSGGWLSFSSSSTNGAVGDAGFRRSAAGVVAVSNGQAGAGALEWSEQAAPAAPAANGVRLYAQDNGAGKTQLMALFATGAAQQVAIEP